MKRFLFTLLLVSVCQFAFAGSDRVAITAEQWALPRHGERLLKMEPLRKLIKQWQQAPASTIEISYPGGENGELWVQEMKDWLIALGVPSEHIQTIAGSGVSDIIELSVVATGGMTQ